jgi:2-polyprenyl-6-methoxyphenol hydroxylase-like FAD-dependent oxidoreductase
MGDSAYRFLPTSVQGASQAIEDGVTIATLLHCAAHPAGIPSVMLAYENIQYDHVCRAQETGKAIREMWHKTDLYAHEFDPESIKMPFRPWIFENDAERVAVDGVKNSAEIEKQILGRTAAA